MEDFKKFIDTSTLHKVKLFNDEIVENKRRITSYFHVFKEILNEELENIKKLYEVNCDYKKINNQLYLTDVECILIRVQTGRRNYCDILEKMPYFSDDQNTFLKNCFEHSPDSKELLDNYLKDILGDGFSVEFKLEQNEFMIILKINKIIN